MMFAIGFGCRGPVAAQPSPRKRLSIRDHLHQSIVPMQGSHDINFFGGLYMGVLARLDVRRNKADMNLASGKASAIGRELVARQALLGLRIPEFASSCEVMFR